MNLTSISGRTLSIEPSWEASCGPVEPVEHLERFISSGKCSGENGIFQVGSHET